MTKEKKGSGNRTVINPPSKQNLYREPVETGQVTRMIVFTLEAMRNNSHCDQLDSAWSGVSPVQSFQLIYTFAKVCRNCFVLNEPPPEKHQKDNIHFPYSYNPESATLNHTHTHFHHFTLNYIFFIHVDTPLWLWKVRSKNFALETAFMELLKRTVIWLMALLTKHSLSSNCRTSFRPYIYIISCLTINTKGW